jgi:predicted transcriptional regulator
MQRVKHQPVRNKIDLTNASQVRAWTKRLDISADELRAIINKVGDSVATVTKQIELRRTTHSLSPAAPGAKPEFSAL